MVHGVNEQELKWNCAEKSKTFCVWNNKTNTNKVTVLILFWIVVLQYAGIMHVVLWQQIS